MHELDKSHRKREVEKGELQNGLEEAEAALEPEEEQARRAGVGWHCSGGSRCTEPDGPV